MRVSQNRCWLIACLLPLLALAAPSRDEDGAEIHVVEKNAATPPHADNTHVMRRLQAIFKTLPDEHKVRMKLVTRSPGPQVITFVETLTPLNAAGQEHGEELQFANWYQEPVRTALYENGVKHGAERVYRLTQQWNEKTKRVHSVRYLQAEVPWVKGQVHGIKNTFHPNGKVASQVRFENNQVTGESRSFSDEGKLVRLARYQGGKRHGEMFDYWPGNGKVRRSITYDLGKVNGLAREFYYSGKPKWERQFKDNRQHGVEQHFADDGTVARTRYWLEGQETTKAEFEASLEP